MGASRVDKSAIHLDYISTDISLRALAKKHKVADSTVRRWAKEDGWAAEKQEFLSSAAHRARTDLDAAKAQLLGTLTDRWTRMYSTADKLLEKVDELLALEGDPLAPRDLKSISSVLVDIMTLHSAGDKREEDKAAAGESYEIRIVEVDDADD